MTSEQKKPEFPTIREDTMITRKLLANRLVELFPQYGIAGLYTERRNWRQHQRYLVILQCQVTHERSVVARFNNEALFLKMLPFLCDRLKACRKSWHKQQAQRRAAKQLDTPLPWPKNYSKVRYSDAMRRMAG